jgi:hypothetical protein
MLILSLVILRRELQSLELRERIQENNTQVLFLSPSINKMLEASVHLSVNNSSGKGGI